MPAQSDPPWRPFISECRLTPGVPPCWTNLRPQKRTSCRLFLGKTLLSDAERAEDQIQDVVGGSGAGDVVQGTQRAVEIQQHHLVRSFHRNRAGCLVERSNCVSHQLLLARVREKAAFLLRAGIAAQQPQNLASQLLDTFASQR